MRIFIATLCAVISCGCRSTQQSAIHEIDTPHSATIAGVEAGPAASTDQNHVVPDADVSEDLSQGVTSDTLPPRDAALASPLQLRLVSAQTETDASATEPAAASDPAATADDIQAPSRVPNDAGATTEGNPAAAGADTGAAAQTESADGASKPEADADTTYLQPQPVTTITLEQVITSLHMTYPLVAAVFQERAIASGNQLSAWGEFDTKLKGASENQPLGFYETYRNSAGLYQPLYGGGEIFGAYRNGGGDFEPWYQERETNDGGEFKAGVRVPLIRDKEIDARRAQLWRANYDRQIADPVIRANLVEFSREAGFAYWKWVASTQKFRLGQEWLQIAEIRNEQVKRRVELEDLDPPELIDNERLIAKRRAKLDEARRDVLQSAVKLSLFLRNENGVPYVPELTEAATFPPLRVTSEDLLNADIQLAQQNRPELLALDLQWQQLRVDFAEANNMTLPGLDAALTGAQDVGEPTSKKRDKSEFELEASLYLDVPLQRRKGLGKMQAVQAKMAQVAAKRRMVQDKVSAEVQATYAGLIQTRREVENAREAVKLATEMAEIERRKFEVGESDLLKVALREQYALEAAEEVIIATYGHFLAFTDYVAALAIDRPTLDIRQ